MNTKKSDVRAADWTIACEPLGFLGRTWMAPLAQVTPEEFERRLDEIDRTAGAETARLLAAFRSK